MFRLRTISAVFGVDGDGPLHMTEADAIRAAKVMLAIHSGTVVVEIRRADVRGRKGELVMRLEKKGEEWRTRLESNQRPSASEADTLSN